MTNAVTKYQRKLAIPTGIFYLITMDVSFYNFGVILIFFVGFSSCGDPYVIASYDPEEFDVNELLNNPLVIEALESNETNVEERPSQHEPLEKKITRTLKRTHSSNYNSRILSCLGLKYQGNKKIPDIFENLQPAKVNPDYLSLAELEMKFHKQKYKLPWRELEEYPIKEYRGYWAHVCDYFWVKENPDDTRYRACYIKSFLFSDNAYASIKYNFHQLPPSRAEVLRCTCHYYVQSSLKLIHPPATVFAIYKYSDNEYFILKNITKGTHNRYGVFDFWTKVMLPIPVK